MKKQCLNCGALNVSHRHGCWNCSCGMFSEKTAMEAEDYVMPTEKHEDRPGYPFASKRRPTDLSDEAQLGHATVDAATIVQRLRSMQDPLAHEAAMHIEQLRASLKLRNQIIASAAKLLTEPRLNTP